MKTVKTTLNDHQNLSITDLGLSVRSFNCLKNAGILNLEQLVKMKEEDLLLLKNFGRTSLNEIHQILEHHNLSLGMCNEPFLEGASSNVDKSNSFPLFFPEPIPYDQERLLELKEVDVKFLKLTKRAINVLETLRIKNVHKLLFTNSEKIFKCSNCGRKTLIDIQDVVRNFLMNKEDNEEKLSLAQWLTHVESDCFNEGYLRNIFDKDINRKIFERRFALYSRKETLEEIAQSFSLTRERIRQIAKKQLWVYFQSLSLPYKNFVYQFIDNLKINSFLIVDNIDLNRDRASINIFNAILHNLDKQIEFDNDLRFWARGKYGSLKESLDDFLFNECKRGLIYSESDIVSLCNKFIQKKSKFSVFAEVLPKMIIPLYFKRGGSDFYFGGVTSKSICEKIIKEEFPNGFKTNTDINKFLLIIKDRGLESYINRDKYKSNHSFISFIISNENIILWDWGVYIHVDNVNLDYPFLTSVMDWLEDKLINANVGKISVWAAIKNFKEECYKRSIQNEHALYSLLKLVFSERFYFRKDPYITLNKTKKSSYNSRNELLEKYILNKGSSVTIDEIQEDLGLKNYQIDQSRYSLPNIIPWGDRGTRLLIHINNITFSSQLRKAIEDQIISLTNEYNHICIAKIFREYSSQCEEAGITSPYSLYYYLLPFISNEVNFPRFPVVTNKNYAFEDDGRFSLNDILNDYFKKECRPFSRNEIINYFVTQRGYSQRLVDNIYYIFPQTLKYTYDSYVFLPSLEWIDSKDKDLLALCRDIYQKNLSAGRPFVTVHELKDYKLPVINEKSKLFDWTDELLTSLLSRFDCVRFLSQSRESFMFDENISDSSAIPRTSINKPESSEDSILESLIFQ